MSTDQFIIRPATTSDINLIQNLAAVIWRDYYPAIISSDQIEYMLEKMYSLQSLEEQLNKGHRFYLIEEKQALGFMSISDDGEGNYFVHKIYVVRQKHKKGIGSLLFEEVCSRQKNVKFIRLTVNRQNIQAINFYFKKGFIIEKAADFDIGNNYVMNDFVMLKEIKN